MCSVIGYSGNNLAAPILVKYLKKMEYRGYDSVGISTCHKNSIITKKKVGSIYEVNKKNKLDRLPGNVGIGHTRWATHGSVTDINAHPHASNSGKISIVHNGIIENYMEIKKHLMKNRYKFYSDTDSEVIANLLQYNFEKTSNIKKSMINTIKQLHGKYSFITILDNKLIAVRHHKSLMLGTKDGECFISSDILGIPIEIDDIIYLKDQSFVILGEKRIEMYDFSGEHIRFKTKRIEKKFHKISKLDYKHFTLKEIIEQSKSILQVNKRSIMKLSKLIKNTEKIYIIGSGTSYNAALIAKYLMVRYCKKIVDAMIAEEFTILPNMDEDSAIIAISQSGETADVIDAVDMANKENLNVYAIVNVPTSLLTTKCDCVVKINCGIEIGVAATKSFTSQLATIYLLLEEISNKKLINLASVSKSILMILENKLEVINISKILKNVKNMYVLGNGIHYPIASEGALKLKELSTIHAESMFGGELKHGSLTLIDENAYVIAINPKDSTYDDMKISISEIKSRGAKIVGISNHYNELYDYWIRMPTINEFVFPLIEIIPLQLLAYYLALEKNLDPDHPKNLAKSVTVK
ncbi:MAG: glutamine--fructose-6-phosphate transaminase (isomerizing) [Thaumarchaeota archaeon]|nr:glutamine--fructose-6-phosphate transaminase (isomerizing) [Nitrososphaerota archaeon]